MGGSNPYTEKVEAELPKQKYKVTFLPMNTEVEVDPAALPYGRDGVAGSILDIALAHHIDIEHACGGVVACSTCHIHVTEGGATCQEASEDEEDMLDTAPGIDLNSRLSCQAVPNGTCNVVIKIPGWNRNHAKEAPH
jgi:ferredoxin, 2Fe-2S